jgi:DNA-binding CsgD family transcriptional regulator
VSALDVITLVDLGYEVRADSLAWLEAMVEPVTTALDVSLVHGTSRSGPTHTLRGVFCFGSQGLEHTYVAPSSPAWLRSDLANALQNGFGEYSAAQLRQLEAELRAPGIRSLRELTGSLPETDLLRVRGCLDSPVLIVHPGDRPPALFGVFSEGRVFLDRGLRALWRKVAIHLGAGCGLSGRLTSTGADDVECVLTADGDVQDARGPAGSTSVRLQLRQAARDVERARSRTRADAHAALDLWRGLCCGRWSLTDHFDSDDRRFVLARRNDPALVAPRNLPLRQRQTLFHAGAGLANQEIAHALGIHASTVATHLRRALRAIGLSSRADWVVTSAALDVALRDASSVYGAGHGGNWTCVSP